MTGTPGRGEPWRTEADDEWLATHRSDTFAVVRRLLRPWCGLVDGVSRSEAAGLLGGSDRHPPLKVVDVRAGVVRYVHQQVAYTRIRIDLGICRTCGARLEERHRVTVVDAAGARTAVGVVRRCQHCDRDSWMFRSGMPATRAARERDRRVVL